ncbi:MAG TPA: DUF1801 domain-containing protein [Spirochaetales bacterium]|nr:DUF1801 domain-containing protein [Spirochaetales bacterium]
MKEPKTRKTEADPAAFVEAIPDEGRRRDAARLLELMVRVSGERPAMWGGSIVGFGRYAYRYASGREGEWFRIGFAPRARAMSLYLMGLAYKGEELESLLARLGRHELGKGCLYLRRLEDADQAVLEELLRLAWAAPGLGEAPAPGGAD